VHHRPLESKELHLSIRHGRDVGGYVAEKSRSELPKADIGKSCIRLKRLDDLNLDVLAKVLKGSERTLAPLRNR
jgi:hypothetical protein